MRRQQLGIRRLAVMALFCVSCVGLLLFLWSSFGGALPLAPRGYQAEVELAESGALTEQAEVRTSGVTIGRVVGLRPERGRTIATLELDDGVVPLPRDVRATLRQKTVLGEAYLELSQGTPGGPALADGQRLRAGAVQPSVEFDELLRAFDAQTRAALRSWLTDQAEATRGRSADLNAALGTLPSTEASLAELLDALEAQGDDLATLVRNTSTVFEALAQRRGGLGRLLVAGERVLGTTGRRDRALEATVRELPGLQREVRITLPALASFARDARPRVMRLRPLARELGPALTALGDVAPDLRGVLAGLGPLAAAGRDGLPAARRLLADLPPGLGDLDPFLAQLEPLVRHVAPYGRELTAMLANATAATQAEALDGSGRKRHYLRTTNPINAEALTAAAEPGTGNRADPYAAPGAARELATGLRTSQPAGCDGSPLTFAPEALAPLGERIATTLDATWVRAAELHTEPSSHAIVHSGADAQ
ncbi:MAG TPA: MlaD family protein, partial [Baekduia sp.]|nr:MlaD family protein [Baekduia sp.]